MHEIGDGGSCGHVWNIGLTSEEAGNTETMAFDIKGSFAAFAVESATFDFGVTIVVGAISGSAAFAFEFGKFKVITVIAV